MKYDIYYEGEDRILEQILEALKDIDARLYRLESPVPELQEWDCERWGHSAVYTARPSKCRHCDVVVRW